MIARLDLNATEWMFQSNVLLALEPWGHRENAVREI
jgi:hypothetical protein